MSQLSRAFLHVSRKKSGLTLDHKQILLLTSDDEDGGGRGMDENSGKDKTALDNKDRKRQI